MSSQSPSPSQSQFPGAPALLVEARYRDRTLCSRLLPARSVRPFTVGAGRKADAPVDLIYLPAHLPANDNHTLVEATGAGFLVNLSPAMRARLEETPTHLRIPCGEVIFDISAVAPAPPVPRPWLGRDWRTDGPYTAGAALALLLLLALVHAVPSDPHALSLDDVGRNIRLDSYKIVPRAIVEPDPIAAITGRGPAGGSAPSPRASGPSGTAGDRNARPADTRRATKGPALRQDARAVAAYVRANTMLAVLDGPRASALSQVLADTPALGSDADNVIAHLQGRLIASAFGGDGLGPTGTGAGNADEGKPLIGGTPGLGTIGHFGGSNGPQRGYGDNVGRMKPRPPHGIEISIGEVTHRGGLDKEIVRRIVRQHLNEVRFCYEQGLARRPGLAGRVVVQFTIASTGRVLVSALQTSSLGEPPVDACIVGAVRRWEFPQPLGGGIVVVSYPFQLAPAGG
jgi:TonB family protein